MTVASLTPHPQRAIGVFGGTFDPIHYGHLRMAEELAEALALEEVRIIPAGQPPHRGAPRTPARHRLEMARRAVADNPRFRLDEREVRLARASYTVDTLADLRAELGNSRPIWLFMGADAFLGLAAWKEWRRLFELAHIAVAHRPGYRLEHSDTLNDRLRQELDRRQVPSPPPAPAGGILLRPTTQLDIAATDIRSRLKAGHSVRYLVPDSVLDYIRQNRLYSPV
ncbi:MAG: nicotinate-nucleotide adenylyltransferase [Pseudomonadota bacterium]